MACGADYRPEELAAPEAFARDPSLLWEWYRLAAQKHIARLLAERRPRRAGALVDEADNRTTVVTQNVDDLHVKAGTARLVRLRALIWELSGVGWLLRGRPYPWRARTGCPMPGLPRCPRLIGGGASAAAFWRDAGRGRPARRRAGRRLRRLPHGGRVGPSSIPLPASWSRRAGDGAFTAEESTPKPRPRPRPWTWRSTAHPPTGAAGARSASVEAHLQVRLQADLKGAQLLRHGLPLAKGWSG